MKKHVYKQHISIFEVYLLIKCDHEWTCLLFTDLRASRTTRVGWEGGIYVSMYFKIWRSGWEILPITLCPFLHFVHWPRELILNQSFTLYLIYPLPHPLSTSQPLYTSDKIRFQDVVTFFSMTLLTASLLCRVGMTVMGAIQKSGTENPFK